MFMQHSGEQILEQFKQKVKSAKIRLIEITNSADLFTTF